MIIGLCYAIVYHMLVCTSCGKKSVTVSMSRHKKGSSGHGGAWNLRAQINSRLQHPNLHIFKGKKYCTKCLRIAKSLFKAKTTIKPQAAPAATLG